MAATLGAVQTALWGIITFSILVVLHEMGHFLAARAFGVKVHEFMIGLPGPALRLRTKNLDWGVTAVPLGGYVRIAGMEPGEEDALLGPALVAIRDHGPLGIAEIRRVLDVSDERATAILLSLDEWKAIKADADGRYALTVDGAVESLGAKELLDAARSVTYRGQSAARRITILAMGVVTNLLVAMLTFTVFFSVWGYVETTTRVDAVSEDSPAQSADIRVGDRLLAVDGETFSDWDTFQMILLRTAPGDEVTITVERADEELDIPVTLAERDGHGFLGVGPATVPIEHPGLIKSVRESLRYMGLVARSIGDLFVPAKFAGTVKNFTGPIGVSVMAKDAAQSGPLAFAALMAMLSLSLGMINILPLPPLDGGKIALEIVERVMGRPLSRSATLAFSAVGSVLLFSLIGYVMYLDILRYAI